MKINSWEFAVGLPLLLCSLVAITLILEKIVYLSTKKGLKKSQKKQVFDRLKQQNINTALDLLLQANIGYAPAIIELKAYQHCPRALTDEAIKMQLTGYSQQLNYRLSALMTIASLAPMLGLLGTIIGLMRAFRNISLSHGPIEPSIVANGLWQALTTTAIGMIIAVICVFFYSLLTAHIRRHLSQALEVINQFSHKIELINHVSSKMHLRKTPKKKTTFFAHKVKA